MKNSSRILSLLLALALVLTVWPGLAAWAAADGPAAPGAFEEAFVADEVLAPAASEQEARHIAEAYGLTIKSYAYGIAVLAAPDAQAAVAHSLAMAATPLPRGAAPPPRLSLNRIYSINADAAASGGTAEKPEKPEKYERPGTPGLPEKYERPGTPGLPEKYEQPGAPGLPEKYERPGATAFPEKYERPAFPDKFRAAGLYRMDAYGAVRGTSESVYRYGGAADKYARAFLPYGLPQYGAAGWPAPGPDLYGAPESDMQWHHDVMDSERAWGISRGANVVVAVIDTGIDTEHPDFAGRISALSYNSHTDQIGLSYVMDDYGHGTHVSGIAAGALNNSAGVSGLAPQARILTIKSNIPEDPGSLESASWMRGLNYAVENGAQVVNMSFGRPYFTEADDLEQAVISNAVARGVTVICAAGNDRDDHAGYPAAYAEAIAVSALQYNSRFESAYSNHGPEIDIAAPGSYIYSTVVGGDYDYMSGTSMASPCVTGVAALIKYVHPSYSPQQVRETLCQTARQAGELGKDDYYGYGIVNAYTAVLPPNELCNITFDYNDDSRAPVTVKVASGSTLPEPLSPQWAGYAFAGWFVDGTNSLFDFEQAISANINLHARWVSPQAGMYFTEFPDLYFRREVLRMVNENGLRRAEASIMNAEDIAALASFTGLYVSDMGIADMTGLKYFPALEYLDCALNELSGLDISHNTALEYLDCGWNELTTVGISANSVLKTFACWGNQLTELDLSNNSALEILNCAYNHLTALNISDNIALERLFCWSNPLSKLDVSKNIRLESLDCEDNGLTALDVSKNIALQTLWCSYNYITELDITNNTKLAGSYDGFWVSGGLMCSDNPLKTLELSKNTDLEVLVCSYNQLTTLDVSRNTALKYFDCRENQLTKLDVSQNTALEALGCVGNQLTELDLTNNTKLSGEYLGGGWYTGGLQCHYNQLKILKLPKSADLRILICDNNNLAALDVSANSELELMACYENYLDSPDSVIGWQESGLVLDETFLFYPQKIIPEAAIFGVLTAHSHDDGGDYYVINGEKMYTASAEPLAHIPALVAYSTAGGETEFCASIGGGPVIPLSQGVLASGEGAVVHPAVLQTMMNQSLAFWSEGELFAVSGTAESYNSATKELSVNSQNLFITSDSFLYDLSADGDIGAAGLVGQGVIAVYGKNGEAVFVAAIGNMPVLGTYLEEFPDANFRREVLWLLNDQDDGDRTDSSIISWSDLIMMASETHLYLWVMDIADMTGLQHFCGLQYFGCGYNQLTKLDISGNSALEGLYCNDNQLTTLDVSKNAVLRQLDCSDNQLSSLNISKNTALEYLACVWNQLSTLDVSANIVLEDLYCRGNQLSTLDVSQNAVLRFLGCGYNQLTTLDVSKQTTLAYLSCSSNQLGALDISKNTMLMNVDCSYNQLLTLDVSKQTALEYLSCDGNQLATLDVSNNTMLWNLYCGWNQLTALDIAKNTALTYVDCNWNQLLTLDVSNNTALEYLSCSGNQLSALNVSNNRELVSLRCYYNPLHTLDVTANTILGQLDCDGTSLSTLDVSKNTALWDLDCRNNHLSKLDVSQNTMLEYLNCSGNQLTELDVSKNTELWDLYCQDNLLTALDVANAANLYFLDCRANYLESTDDVSGWQQNGLVLGDTFLYHPQKTDFAAGTYLTEFPDANFRREVLSLLNDWDGGNRIDSSNISWNDLIIMESVTYLNVEDMDIAGMTGLKYFSGLRYLYCEDNQLTELDVSQSIALEYLYCQGNQITALDVSNNRELVSLRCYYNPLHKLDVSANRKLEYLDCDGTQLTTLDVSQNTALSHVDCRNNQLRALDIAQNTMLEYLNCSGNQLTELDVSTNTALWDLYCQNNLLAKLDVSNNRELVNLICFYNPLHKLDVSANTKLEYLDCDGTQLTTLDVSQNTALSHVDCRNNQLRALDVSQNTALEYLICFENYMISPANVKGWQEIGLVLDETFLFYPQKTGFEIGTYLVEFPDANFRAEVLRLMNEDGGNRIGSSAITLEDLNALASFTSLYVDDMEISDMTGLQYFTGLLSLGCAFNQITTLDTSHSPALEYLFCYNNLLTTLDVTKNTELRRLLCFSNQLKKLDITNNTKLGGEFSAGEHFYPLELLSGLDCSFNQLETLDLSKNINLIVLECNYNRLTSLDVSHNSALRFLDCGGNQLTTLDTSKNTALRGLVLYYNQLAGLDVSGNSALEGLVCIGNLLTALDVSQNATLKRIDCFENYMTSPDSVIGWRELGLVINSPENLDDGTFRFYNQKTGSGFTLSGLVKTYNPQRETTLELWREGEAEAVYTFTIDKEESGSGQREQPFAFEGVEPGAYTLVITKAAHTKFTVHNIVVADKDVDLTQDKRPEVQLMTLRCGDINGDGNINNSDLTIMWQQANYNRSAAAADNELCDLNGDGLINNIDLTILWLAYNYNRGEVEIN